MAHAVLYGTSNRSASTHKTTLNASPGGVVLCGEPDYPLATADSRRRQFGEVPSVVLARHQLSATNAFRQLHLALPHARRCSSPAIASSSSCTLRINHKKSSTQTRDHVKASASRSSWRVYEPCTLDR